MRWDLVAWALVLLAAAVFGAALGIWLADHHLSCIAVRSILVCHHVK